ncbi:protein phosphatase 2C 57 isoform X1 [Neltuma alba]|uniref:protein phosphatase 2C 57 isoform X1 n=1 Tax=Neltuma alba TaxID=207710 RepID=UPI0010A53BD8|nr:protein phosphatase 2C 57 isoform X1 [Prosopis alba]
MALSSPHIQRLLVTKLHGRSTSSNGIRRNSVANTSRGRCCSAIAIDTPSSFSDVAGIRWGSIALQGLREEMEDDIVVRPDGLHGFSFAAVFDGHGGFSSVEFLREELYKECLAALHGGLILDREDFQAIKAALEEAFVNADTSLLKRLEMNEDESGATATAMFVRDDVLLISHLGDSSAVLSRAGRAEELTSPHRPYGSNKFSLQEIKRIREAGGWIVNGRICGDIAVSRAFGDVRFKTKKNEMLRKGTEEGRWSEKFASRVQLNRDLIIACPDINQVHLGSDAEFIVLASDGLWDYMKRSKLHKWSFSYNVSLREEKSPSPSSYHFSSEAVSFVRNQLREHGDIQLACEALARAALDRRTQDNISIIIADLGRTDWRNLPLQQQNVIYEAVQALATIGIVSLGIWFSSQIL